MFDSYCTDIIRIIPVSYDSKGVITEGTESDDIPARVEDANRLLRDDEGKEVMPNMLVAFDFDNTINKMYKIKIKKKYGVDYFQPDKKWEIKRLEKWGMFSSSHVEVYL
jgi:hypothetical protein